MGMLERFAGLLSVLQQRESRAVYSHGGVMNSELTNLLLFAWVLAKVALLTGFAPAIAIAIFLRSSSGGGQLARCNSVAMPGNKPAPEERRRCAA
jgi:hypothetical protein